MRRTPAATDRDVYVAGDGMGRQFALADFKVEAQQHGAQTGGLRFQSEGMSNSPCYIIRRPRTKLPTGQPVTRMPS